MADPTADAIHELVRVVRDLGNGNAVTNMGAIENLAMVMKEGLDKLSDSVRELADAIREGFDTGEGLDDGDHL